MSRLILSILFISTFAACNNEEIASSKDVNPESVFLDYNFTGSEETGQATLKMQYRFGGISGTTLVLESPSEVKLDGQVIPVDSSGSDGAYYEVTRPATEFAGKHQVSFTGFDGKQYTDTVDFSIFTLAGGLADSIGREELTLQLEGLAAEEAIQLVMTDTVRFSKGIERWDTIRNGKLVIGKEDLDLLKDGPVNLELIRQKNVRLKNTPKEGGRVHYSYNIHRELYIR